MYWGVNEFSALYESFKNFQCSNTPIDDNLFNKLSTDLKNVLVMSANEQKNQEHRKSIESGKFTINDEEYEVNKEFIFTVIQLSDQLNCNEKIIAQLLLEVVYSENENVITEEGDNNSNNANGAHNLSQFSETKLENKAKIAFYLRRQYILQILNFMVNTNSPLMSRLLNDGRDTAFIDNIIPSFKNIHQQLQDIKDMVNKYQILDQYDHFQQMNANFRKNFLVKEYDLLSQILYGLVSTGVYFMKETNITTLVDFVSNDLQNNDSFVLYFMPSLLKIPSVLNFFQNDSIVFKYFDNIVNDIEKNENLYLKPIKVLYYFIYLTYFISWCKEDPEKRIFDKKLDFETKLNKPMYQLVQLGAIEQLMIFSYETSATGSGVYKDSSLEDEEGYDFKNLLEKHLPKFTPYQLIEPNQLVYIGKPLKLSDELLNSFLIPSLHDFTQEFIANCAFLLTTLKDQEEDYVLSGSTNEEEVMLLDSIVKKADLERFFISVYYIYKNRPALNKIFWSDKQSTAFGFIEWSAKCSDTLMRSCFFIMLSGLSSDSSELYEYISENSKNGITWEILATILSEYILKISKWESKNMGTEPSINTLALKSNTNETKISPTNNSSLQLSSQQQMHMQLPLQQQLQYQFNGGNTVNAFNSQRFNNNNFPQNFSQNINKTGSQSTIESQNNPIVIISEDLNEEVVIYLSSVLSLINSTARNLKSEYKNKLAVLFTDILFEFLKLKTPLTGAILTTISSLISPENSSKIWAKLDKFIFHDNAASSFSSGYKNYFLNSLTTFKSVTGFLQIFETLISYETDDFVPFGQLEVPIKLGERNRTHLGVAPYLEYIMDEVFKNSPSIIDPKQRHSIQLVILRIIQQCLMSFDYQVIIDSNSSIGTNLDSLVPQNNFIDYVMESPSTLILNHLFDETVHNILFFIISVGYDKLVSEEDVDAEFSICLNSLIILNRTLDMQDTFLEEMYPIVREQVRMNTKYYIPKSFGLHGQRTFFDAILFNLPLVAHVSLYIGLENKKLSSTSLSILDKVSTFGSSKQIVLNIFNSVDESSRIKQSFIDQIESSIETNDDFAMKVQVLKYLKTHLTKTQKPSVTHFLLGFQVSPILNNGPAELNTFVSSESSLLRSLIVLIQQSLSYISVSNVDYSPIKLISETFQIILSLCKNELTSVHTLNFLHSLDFFNTILIKTPDVDNNTFWNGKKFADFTCVDVSFASILEFFKFRHCLLQFFSLEIHRLKFTELGHSYVEALSSTLILKSSKVFSFLDVIKHYNVGTNSFNPSELFTDLTIYQNGLSITDTLNSLERVDVFINYDVPTIYDFTALDSLLNLRTSWLKQCTGASVDLALEAQERQHIKSQITQFKSSELFNNLQLDCLHSWVQLVQVLVTDGGLSPLVRCGFIMEIFETIIPQINDLVDMNLRYSEELVSMTVFLYELYDSDRSHDMKSFSVDKKFYSLFKTCMHGIISPLSSISMRSDLYVIANRFITKLFKSNINENSDADRISLAKEVLFELKMTSDRLIEVIASDAIGGEGPHRLTSLLFLDSLVQLAGLSKVNFVISALSRTNMLLLIIRSLKVIDDLLFVPNDKINADHIFYELTVFKTTMNFLIHVAETKHGAQELIQGEVLRILGLFSFVNLDSNLGIELLLNEKFDDTGNTYVELKVNLDESHSKHSDMNTISLFELFIPIFQLMSAIVLSIGNENRLVLRSVNNVLKKYEKVIQGIIRKDALIEAGDYHMSEENERNLKDLVKLIIVLCTLTKFDHSL